jgi:hypothetical protein
LNLFEETETGRNATLQCNQCKPFNATLQFNGSMQPFIPTVQCNPSMQPFNTSLQCRTNQVWCARWVHASHARIAPAPPAVPAAARPAAATTINPKVYAAAR